MTAPLYCALVHHPIRSREGATVTSAVTTLDVHDIARSARTYGVRRYFVVTPIDAQHVLIDRVLDHWRSGAGVRRMPERGQALAVCEPSHSVAEVGERIRAETGLRPRVVATAARATASDVTTFSQLRDLLRDSREPFLLLLGTGHGLTDQVIEAADYLLEPIHGTGDYNHLSVRSAAAIALDRLCYPRPR
ncbi:MAG: RNA methyltransferase [Myxococcales bacterium]|nr:RNA methyltransferase [Myxococcales bacterium]MDD9967812.1 RNA methyltransferase [Myxococcales bacterium]